jgi:hypothetical protein
LIEEMQDVTMKILSNSSSEDPAIIPDDFTWMQRDQQSFRSYVLGLPDDNISHILGSIPSAWNGAPKGHSEAAQVIIHLCRPKTIVELGVDFGYSSFLMALCARSYGGRVFGIDCFGTEKHGSRLSEDYDFVKSAKQKLRLDNLEIIKDYFDNVAQVWHASIDLLHIDGLHDYNSCKNDYDRWSPFLSNKGIILFHDTVSYPNDVGRFFAELHAHKLNMTNSNGLGLACFDDETFSKIHSALRSRGLV